MTTSSFISEGLSISGDIEFSEELVIAGSVNGTIKFKGEGRGLVRVLSSGIVVGEIQSKSLEILGKVEAEVTCTKLVSIKATANVTGTLKYMQLEVQSDAVPNVELIPMPTDQIDQKVNKTTIAYTANQDGQNP
tara:strand:+ start:51 stop:452 length:402 start_codon:yes stop_codon:yes gene_type:complete